MKAVLPSLKEKKRYLVFEVISKTKLSSFKDVAQAITSSILTFIGTKGSAKAGLVFIDEKWNQNKQKGIVKVNNKYLNDLKASLALIKDINKKPSIIRSVGVSGMLTKAEKKYIG